MRSFGGWLCQRFWMILVRLLRWLCERLGELGVGSSTLGKWVAKHRRDNPVVDEPLTLSERAEFERAAEAVEEGG